MKTIYNPFEKVSENKLLIYGLLLTLAGSFTAYFFNARYDGAIDVHLTHNVAPWQPLADNVIDILTLGGFLYILGYYINKKTRVIDVFNAVLIARAPFYILPVFNAGNYLSEMTASLVKSGADISHIDVAGLIFTLIFGLFSLVMLVWAMALLYHGFKTATNCKTTKQVIAFIITILLAETLSGYLITTIPY